MQDEFYWEDQWQPPAPPGAGSRSGLGIAIFLLLSLLVCVSAALFVPSGLGLIVGYGQLQTQNHEAAIQHFNRGLGYLAENYPELAYTEFEIALKLDDAYEPAQQKLRELQATFGGLGTPEPEQAENRVASSLFSEARTLVSQKKWSDAITRLEQLRTLKVDYRKPEVNDLLYQAYVAGGKEAVAVGQIELARERFEAALTLRGGDAEVQRQRDLAVLYLDGQQAVGYNWQTAIQKFSALYQQDPNYDDVKRRLLDAYMQYGDLAAKQNAWCLAVREYDGALTLSKDAQLTAKRAQVMSLCRQAISATPTLVAVTGTDDFTWTKATATDKPCNGVGDVSGVVRDALGRPMPGASVGYYADGITLVATRTNSSGQYQFILGRDAGVFHLIILTADGKTPASLTVDVQYPGGNNAGCHIVLDWQKVQ